MNLKHCFLQNVKILLCIKTNKSQLMLMQFIQDIIIYYRRKEKATEVCQSRQEGTWWGNHNILILVSLHFLSLCISYLTSYLIVNFAKKIRSPQLLYKDPNYHLIVNSVCVLFDAYLFTFGQTLLRNLNGQKFVVS